jgi:hypothetical protein
MWSTSQQRVRSGRARISNHARLRGRQLTDVAVRMHRPSRTHNTTTGDASSPACILRQ